MPGTASVTCRRAEGPAARVSPAVVETGVVLAMPVGWPSANVEACSSVAACGFCEVGATLVAPNEMRVKARGPSK